MAPNRLSRSYRAAEAAGYPVLLIVSVVALAIVVAPVGLIGMTHSVWALALAVISLAIAIAVVAAAVEAALSDGHGPPDGPATSR